ncbi:hypothetical protein AB0I72_26625 [Nocardiopsis sp. NPDC049922]|uniref:hypothetical protein n=1 Tax=Nocardiopsis sp. NPDC049922 TaxID=3155157 RepID=UPI0033E7D6BD
MVDGPPDTWPVVSRTEAGEWWDEHAMSMNEYLYRMHTQGRLCRSCPRVYEDPAVFKETGP